MPADAITEATNEVANLSIGDADEDPAVNENTDDIRDSTAEAEPGAETGDTAASLPCPRAYPRSYRRPAHL